MTNSDATKMGTVCVESLNLSARVFKMFLGLCIRGYQAKPYNMDSVTNGFKIKLRVFGPGLDD